MEGVGKTKGVAPAVKGKGKGSAPQGQPKGKEKGKTSFDWRAKEAEKRKLAEEKKKRVVGVKISRLPCGSLDDPRWDTSFAAVASSEGSDGVVFMATKAGSYVIKASSKPAEEYFATKVLRHLGVRSPDIRIACHVDKEWRDIKQAVTVGASLAKSRGDDASHGELLRRLHGPLNRAQLSIMELVPNASSFVGNTQANSFFIEQAGSNAVSCELNMIGRCLGVDILLNNCDRFPASCWDHEGNGGNILLQSCGNATIQVVAIDSAGSCFPTSSDNFKRYSARVRSFLEAVCEETSAANALGGVRDFFSGNCGITLDDAALLEVRRGILQVLSNVTHGNGETFIEWLDALQKRVRKDTVRIDWESVWQKSADLISMTFLREMVSLFCDVVNSHQGHLPSPCFLVPAQSGIDEDSSVARTTQHDMSIALWNALPHEIQEELNAIQDRPFKILVLQMKKTTASQGAHMIDKALKDDMQQTGEMAGLVLIPENAIVEKLESDITDLLSDMKGNAPNAGAAPPPELQAFAHVAKQNSVYIVCGSMYEPQPKGSRSFYITSVVIGPDGSAIGAYRKRKIHDHQVQLEGDRPLLFSVPGFGKVAVLICLDAEDKDLRDEVLTLGAHCVLNPIHIPSPLALDDREEIFKAWQTAVDRMADSFTHICYEYHISWVRCDRPYPDGLGTSQIIGPEYTVKFSSMDAETLSACILPPPISGGHIPLLMQVPSNSYSRSKPEQNCGARCTISNALVDGNVTSLRLDSAKSKRIFTTFVDGSIATLTISPTFTVTGLCPAGSSEYEDTLAEANAHVPEGSADAPEGNTNPLWLDTNRRYSISLNGNGQITLCKIGGDGHLRRPLVVPTSERFYLLAADKQDGTFAAVSTVGDRTCRISYWSFAHNCTPAPLPSFLDL